MDIPLAGKIILYIDISIFGILCLIVLGWQIMVIRGHSMKNPDGSVDDWHEQKLFYGVALADILFGIPIALAGIVLIFVNRRLGYYLTGLASFWFLWANIMTTATSIRFEKPRVTFKWFIVFPFGALVGLVYIVWSIVYFEAIY